MAVDQRMSRAMGDLLREMVGEAAANAPVRRPLPVAPTNQMPNPGPSPAAAAILTAILNKNKPVPVPNVAAAAVG